MTHPASAGRPTDGARTSAESRAQTKTETETSKTTTSLGMALDPWQAPRTRLAAVVASMRSDWTLEAVLHAIEADDRPFRVVALAHITAAYDPDTVSPNRARTIPLGTVPAAQPLPNVHDALNPELCKHEFRVGACPECRRTR